MRRFAITKVLIIGGALSLSGCQTMNDINAWIEDNPDRVKMAALGGLGGLMLAGHFTGAALPAIAAGGGGALIGWKVTDLLYEEEQEAHAEAIRFAADGPTDKEFAWINPESGHKGAVVATEDARTTAYGEVCREVKASVETREEARVQQHTLCKHKDGVWRVAG